jgi:hypothetical protein
MIREVIQDARQIRREMPVFTELFLLLVALCIGVRGAVFYEADGENLRLVADKGEAQADPLNRMYARARCPMRIPGFTVIVGLHQYSVELSVPAATVHAFLNSTHPASFRTFIPEVRVAI